MKKINSRLIFLVLGLFSLCPDIRGQNGGIVIDADIRVFSVLAALQVAGPDDDASRMNEVRLSISKEFQNLPKPLRERLQKFYREHSEGKKNEDQISRYISLALLSEGPPDFKPSLPLTSLPPDAHSVYEFLDIVKEFYATARLEVIWSKYRQFYDEAIAKYRPLINQVILTSDGYLRIASGSFLDRRLTIIPEFLVPSNTFNARTYRESYYLVFGPSDKLKTDEIRHQYLHFILDPFAMRFTLPRDTRIALTKFVETAPNIETQYRTDLQFLATESLIRAIELRMNKVPDTKAKAELDSYIRSGALLSRHFYDTLPAFEASQEGIRLYYPGLVKTIQMEKVEASFNEAQKAPVQRPPELSEVEKLLEHGNSELGSNNLVKAKELFESVLKNYDATRGEALYGLGIIASIQNDRQSAKESFQRVLLSPSSDRSIKVWAHIYLGRLHDVEGNREDAILEYQAALDVGDNTRNAREVAQRGLKEPFNLRKHSSTP